MKNAWQFIVILTPFVVKTEIKNGLYFRSRVVRKAWEADKISEKWAESAWAKRMVMKQRRQGLNDFDRFKLYKAKSARNKILAKAVNIKKNKLSKAGKL